LPPFMVEMFGNITASIVRYYNKGSLPAWRSLEGSGFVSGFRDLLWVLRGHCLILGALYPSKSLDTGPRDTGNKLQTQTYREAYAVSIKHKKFILFAPSSTKILAHDMFHVERTLDYRYFATEKDNESVNDGWPYVVSERKKQLRGKKNFA
jgi:hypothetical protein